MQELEKIKSKKYLQLKHLFLFIIILFFIPNYLLGQEVTFSEHIAPIIFENCTPCHRPKQIAPMPFTNYEEISTYGSMIKYVTEIKYMPPWKATNSDYAFKGERGLTDHEIGLIKKWVEGGVIEGNPSKTPSIPPFDDTPKLKNPDAVFSMSEAFEQYGVYYDQFKVFVLPTNLTEEKQVSAIEFVPGNSSIVRSCFISIDTTERVKNLDEWDPTYGYFSFGEIGFVPNESRWYTWTPLKPMTVFPEGITKQLPVNSKILLHIHYGPTGVPIEDRSELRLKFSNQKSQNNIQNVPLIHPYNLTNPPFLVPKDQLTRYHAKFVVPFDIKLRSLMPHSQLLGNTWEVFTVNPDTKKAQVLLKIEDWDLKWKDQFDFAEPVILKKGTVIHTLAQYDNTLNNPSNPSDPPRSMTWGKRMFEDMFLAYFEITPIVNRNEITLLFNPSMVFSNNLTFRFFNEKNQKLSLELKNFNQQNGISIFKTKSFLRGKQAVKISLKDLQKGNYFLEITNEAGEILARHIFVNVQVDLFD